MTKNPLKQAFINDSLLSLHVLKNIFLFSLVRRYKNQLRYYVEYFNKNTDNNKFRRSRVILHQKLLH